MPSALLAFLQFFFALTWVVYVIYLPALAEQAGIDRKYVPMILMMDQVIFLACDWAAGMFADRLARKFARVGTAMAAVTLASCAAFIALPWIAPLAGKEIFLFLTVLWSATSSALRAPPFVIVSRHTATRGQPWVACAYLFGIGAASAIAPYIAIELRQVEPRIPFAVASIGLALFAIALARAERSFTAPAPEAPMPARYRIAPAPLLAMVILLFAFGYQVHFAINSVPFYLRFAQQEHLPRLMPVFWIGFCFGLVGATLLVRRYGGSAIMVLAGMLGVVSLTVCAHAPDLHTLIIAQTFAGMAWCLALTSAFSAALEAGRPGREGLLTGILFSTLAAAAILRLTFVAWSVSESTKLSSHMESLPYIAWALAAFLMAMVAFPERARRPASPG